MSKQIPLIRPDLPPFQEIEDDLRTIISSGSVTNFGAYAQQFEREASEYLGAEAVAVSSGTLGLLFALQALGVAPGDYVALPSFTFVATIQAVLYAGARPVFVDVDDDLHISTDDLQGLLKNYPRVNAVIPVHMYGLPCKTDEIEAAVEGARRTENPIRVVYDAAHAFGSARSGKRVGASGDAEAFSLSATKVLVSIEGGMVATRDTAVAAKIRKMRNYGIEASYDAHHPGLNGKMSELHAAIGLYNLRRLDNIMAERQAKARYYLEAVRTRTPFRTMEWPPGVTHTFKDLTILADSQATRDATMSRLAERGIETRAYFWPPAHEQQRFKRFCDRPLPRTEWYSRRVITLPFYTTMNSDEMDYVVDALAHAQGGS